VSLCFEGVVKLGESLRDLVSLWDWEVGCMRSWMSL
jgi:hypothetical protein